MGIHSSGCSSFVSLSDVVSDGNPFASLSCTKSWSPTNTFPTICQTGRQSVDIVSNGQLQLRLVEPGKVLLTSRHMVCQTGTYLHLIQPKKVLLFNVWASKAVQNLLDCQTVCQTGTYCSRFQPEKSCWPSCGKRLSSDRSCRQCAGREYTFASLSRTKSWSLTWRVSHMREAAAVTPGRDTSLAAQLSPHASNTSDSSRNWPYPQSSKGKLSLQSDTATPAWQHSCHHMRPMSLIARGSGAAHDQANAGNLHRAPSTKLLPSGLSIGPLHRAFPSFVPCGYHSVFNARMPAWLRDSILMWGCQSGSTAVTACTQYL